MNGRMSQVLVVAALSAGAILAQDISGTWQGKVQSGRGERRVVCKITRSSDGRPGAIFYSIDEGGYPIGASSVAVQGGTVKISVPSVGAEYEGKLSADGSTLTGSFTSRGNVSPLTLTRATAESSWLIPAMSEKLKPMLKSASPGFEVATIKPSDPTKPGSGFKMDGRRVFADRESLRAMIMFAYGVHPRQIVDAPAWADSEYFDVNGQPDQPGVPNLDQMRSMYRKLLSERFQLSCHRDKKEMAVYVLTTGKNGPKLTPSERGANAVPDQTMHRPGFLTERNATMGEFAAMLQGSILDRPVVDQTKLDGRFDFMLRWRPDQFQFSGRVQPGGEADAYPDLFTAMQEQLGLKLEATKAPADVLIVDKVAKPSEN